MTEEPENMKLDDPNTLDVGNDFHGDIDPNPVELEPGTFTPKMVNYLLCRLLDDCDGVAVAGKFFENIPIDTGWEAQYDEVNDVWRFFVRTPRKRKAIYRPSRKVITNG